MARDEAQPTTGISRRSMLRGATLAAAGVATAGAMSTVLTRTAKATDIDEQFGWDFCSACSALWWPGGGGGGVICPARNYYSHVIGSSYSYGLNHDLPNLNNSSNPQPTWTWCWYCSMLYWPQPNGGNDGYCPYWFARGVTGAHIPGSNTSYDVSWQGPASPVYGTTTNPQGWWRYCTRCTVLFWSGPNTRNSGVCLEPGLSHTGGPTNYHIDWVVT